MQYESTLTVRNIVPLAMGDNVYEPAITEMLVDPLDCLELTKKGYYELLITEIIKKLVKKGDIVMDLGACIGYHALIMSKLVGSGGLVYAFEPEPRNMDLLIKNKKLNNCQNVIAIQKAVSNQNCISKLYMASQNIGDHRIYDSGEDRQVIDIEVVKINDYFNYLCYDRHIDFIKMDIQGSEALAVDGMYKIFRDNKKITMITEFQPKGLMLSGVEPSAFLNTLLGYKFDLYLINELQNRVEPLDIKRILDEYTPDKDDETDILCIKDN